MKLNIYLFFDILFLMKIVVINIIALILLSACSSARVGAHSDGKHHGVGIKTKVLKF